MIQPIKIYEKFPSLLSQRIRIISYILSKPIKTIYKNDFIFLHIRIVLWFSSFTLTKLDWVLSVKNSKFKIQKVQKFYFVYFQCCAYYRILKLNFIEVNYFILLTVFKYFFFILYMYLTRALYVCFVNIEYTNK